MNNKKLNNKLQKTIQDKRYSISLEWCGYPEQRYVVRFIGDWIGQSKKPSGAILKSIFHQDKRMYNLLTPKQETINN